MKKKAVKKALPVLLCSGILVGVFFLLKLVADSQSRIDY